MPTVTVIGYPLKAVMGSYMRVRPDSEATLLAGHYVYVLDGTVTPERMIKGNLAFFGLPFEVDMSLDDLVPISKIEQNHLEEVHANDAPDELFELANNIGRTLWLLRLTVFACGDEIRYLHFASVKALIEAMEAKWGAIAEKDRQLLVQVWERAQEQLAELTSLEDRYIRP